jgi:uncharacterized repeat protein (TIGR03803 family)
MRQSEEPMRPRTALAILTFSIVATLYAVGQQPVPVHTFVCKGSEGQGGCPNGGVPFSIIQGSDGNFYGVARQTIQLPEEAGGLVFSLTPSGSFTVLFKFGPGKEKNFPNGQDPVQLIEGSDGRLYGETDLGGANNAGTVFRLNRDGSGFRVIHSFCFTCGDGYDPLGLAAGTDGNVYGATYYADASSGGGTIFRVDVAQGTYKVVNLLTSDNPSNPVSGSGGFLYWTLQGNLYIYNEASGKTQEILLNLPTGQDNFPGTANFPVFGANGNLYGIYGTPGVGSGVFEIQPNGSNLVLFQLISNFRVEIEDGPTTNGLVLGGDGNLWMQQSGAEASYGEILTFSPTNGSLLQTLTPFSQTSSVGGYTSDLIAAKDGTLWGLTTAFGDAPTGSYGEGVVFNLTPEN